MLVRAFEFEMVARASKNVLDSLFTRNAGVVALQPASVVVSFFSSIMSTVEETAAEIEARMIRQKTTKAANYFGLSWR